MLALSDLTGPMIGAPSIGTSAPNPVWPARRMRPAPLSRVPMRAAVSALPAASACTMPPLRWSSAKPRSTTRVSGAGRDFIGSVRTVVALSTRSSVSRSPASRWARIALSSAAMTCVDLEAVVAALDARAVAAEGDGDAVGGDAVHLVALEPLCDRGLELRAAEEERVLDAVGGRRAVGGQPLDRDAVGEKQMPDVEQGLGAGLGLGDQQRIDRSIAALAPNAGEEFPHLGHGLR